MSRFTHDTDEDTLDRALDTHALGDPRALDALDRETRATLDHLFAWAALGSLDDPPPVYATPAHRNRGAPIAIDWPRPRRGIPMDATATSPAMSGSPTSQRRVAPAIWSAFAWVVIAALAGASIYGALPYLREDGPAKPTLSAYQPGTATPDAAPETPAVNYGGDAGRTWNLGSAVPLTGAPETKHAPSETRVLGSPLIVNDSLFYSAFDEDRHRFVRYDLDSTETVWEEDITIAGSAASDGIRIFGFLVRNPGTDASLPVPVALSSETGELVWEGPPLVQGSDSIAAGPVLLGDVVYFSDALGNTVALDAASGAVAWQYPDTFAPRVTYGEADLVVGNPPDADMVATEHGIFVERPSTTIVKLDPETGRELDSFNLIDDFGADIQQVGMQGTTDRLVISATRSEKSPLGADAPAPYRPTSLLIFDTDTLQLVAESGLPEITSNMVLADDAILVAGRTDLRGPIGLYRISLEGGTPGEPIHEFEHNARSWFGLSLSDSTLMVAAPDGDFAFIDRPSGNLLASGTIDIQNTALILSPIQMWEETPLAVSTAGDIIAFDGTPAP